MNREQIAARLRQRCGLMSNLVIDATHDLIRKAVAEERGAWEKVATDAAASLETISLFAGVKGGDLEDKSSVRGYANSRAWQAREEIKAIRARGETT